MSEKRSNKDTPAASGSKTGRYVYDKELGKVVKISDEIVGIRKGSAGEGSCPMKPGGHNCGGCCCGN